MAAEMIFTAHPIRQQIQISDMYSFFQVHYDRGYQFSGETHNFWECLYILDGELCVCADDRVTNMSTGEIIFHKPLEFHSFFVTGDAGATVLIFSFSASGPVTLQLRNKVFRLSQTQKRLIDQLLQYVGSVCSVNPKQRDLQLYLHPFNTHPHYSQMVVTFLYHLFLLLSEDGAVTSASSSPDAVTFGNAISYLNCNLHRQPSIAEIARYCSISEASLKRLFEKYAGIGVHKYILKLKCSIAAELLQDRESVSAVAEKLGFTSQSYFSKAFKREMGINPSEVPHSTGH